MVSKEIQTVSVNYGGSLHEVRVEKQKSSVGGHTYRGFVPEAKRHFGSSLVELAVASLAGVSEESLRRGCSSSGCHAGEFYLVLYVA